MSGGYVWPRPADVKRVIKSLEWIEASVEVIAICAFVSTITFMVRGCGG